MILLAKAYRLDPNATTGIFGSLTIEQVPLLDVASVSPVKRAIETGAGVYRYDSVTLSCVGLPDGFFALHQYDAAAEVVDERYPFVVEVQYGDYWDDPGGKCIFYGALRADSVREDKGVTTFTVASFDALLADLPPVKSRPSYTSFANYSAAFVDTFSLRPDNLPTGFSAVVGRFYARIANIEGLPVDHERSIWAVLREGSVLSWQATYPSGGTSDHRLVVSRAVPEGTFNNALVECFMSDSGLYLSKGPVNTNQISQWDVIRPLSPSQHDNTYGNLVIKVAALEQPIQKYVGGICRFRPPGSDVHRGAVRIEKAEYYKYKKDGKDFVDYEWVKMSVIPAVGTLLPEFAITHGVKGALEFIDPIQMPTGTEVTVLSPSMYGTGDPYDASSPNYSARDVVRGIIASHPALSTLIPDDAVTAVSVRGTLRYISRLISLSSKPAEALSQVQTASDALLWITGATEATGAASRLAGGARRIHTHLLSRDEAASMPAITLPTPVEAGGEAVGVRPRYVVIKSPTRYNEVSLNIPGTTKIVRRKKRFLFWEYGETGPGLGVKQTPGVVYDTYIGWYPTVDGLGNDIIPPELDQNEKGALEGAIEVSAIAALPDGSGDVYTSGDRVVPNDATLQTLAERYWNLYGRYWRRFTVKVLGIYDSVEDGVDVPLHYVGAKVRCVTGLGDLGNQVWVEGVILSSEVDYAGGTTTFVLAAEGAEDQPLGPGLNLPPIARLLAPAVIASNLPAGASGDLRALVVLDASGSIDPNGDALSFEWRVNGVIAEGEVTPVVEVVIEDEAEVSVKVVDGGGLFASKSAIVKVVEPAEDGPLDVSHAPVLDVSLSGESNTLTAFVRLEGYKIASDVRVEYYEVRSGSATSVTTLTHDTLVDEVIEVDRPEPGRIVNFFARAVDATRGIVGEWRTLAVGRNPAAEITQASAIVDGPSSVRVTWRGDTDTASVRLELYRHAAGTPLPGLPTVTQMGAATGTATIPLGGSTLSASEVVDVRVVPVRGDGAEGDAYLLSAQALSSASTGVHHYTKAEADARFVNVDGDAMTGPLSTPALHLGSSTSGTVNLVPYGADGIRVLAPDGTTGGVLRIQDLVVDGSVNTVNSTETTIEDRYVRVNAGGEGGFTVASGLRVERGPGENDRFIEYDPADGWRVREESGVSSPLALRSGVLQANLDSEMWGGYKRADYLNQPIRTGDTPTFAGLLVSGNASIGGFGSFGEGAGSTSFVSGFAGSGWRFGHGESGADGEVQNFTVRGTMSVYELLARRVDAVGGNLLVAPRLRVEQVVGVGPSYTLTDEYASAIGGAAVSDVEAGSYLIAQQAAGTGVQQSIVKVTAKAGAEVSVALMGGAAPWLGAVYVAFDHESDATKRGRVYLSSRDGGAPFVSASVGNGSGVWGTGTEYARFGNLSGITALGQPLTGYGLYGGRAHFVAGTQMIAVVPGEGISFSGLGGQAVANINAGADGLTISAQRLRIGSGTTFEGGYDPHSIAEAFDLYRRANAAVMREVFARIGEGFDRLDIVESWKDLPTGAFAGLDVRTSATEASLTAFAGFTTETTAALGALGLRATGLEAQASINASFRTDMSAAIAGLDARVDDNEAALNVFAGLTWTDPQGVTHTGTAGLAALVDQFGSHVVLKALADGRAAGITISVPTDPDEDATIQLDADAVIIPGTLTAGGWKAEPEEFRYPAAGANYTRLEASSVFRGIAVRQDDADIFKVGDFLTGGVSVGLAQTVQSADLSSDTGWTEGAGVGSEGGWAYTSTGAIHSASGSPPYVNAWLQQEVNVGTSRASQTVRLRVDVGGSYPVYDSVRIDILDEPDGVALGTQTLLSGAYPDEMEVYARVPSTGLVTIRLMVYSAATTGSVQARFTNIRLDVLPPVVELGRDGLRLWYGPDDYLLLNQATRELSMPVVRASSAVSIGPTWSIEEGVGGELRFIKSGVAKAQITNGGTFQTL